MNFSTLPNLAALAMLVAVFWAISRRETAERLHLWLAGWFLVLLHFTAQFFTRANGEGATWLIAASFDCLMLASVAFLISVSRVATTWQRQLVMSLAIAVPCLAYTNATLWEVNESCLLLFGNCRRSDCAAGNVSAFVPEVRSVRGGSDGRDPAFGGCLHLGGAQRQCRPGSDDHTHGAEPVCRGALLETSRASNRGRVDDGRWIRYCGRWSSPLPCCSTSICHR